MANMINNVITLDLVKKKKQPDMLLWLSDARGIYIPRDFAMSFKDRTCVTGVSDENWQILEAGPDHEYYWEAWDEVLQNAHVTDRDKGVSYTLHQDGDLWLIPDGMVWTDEDKFEWVDDDAGT